MTDRCEQIRDMAAEVALGVAPIEERVRVLEHAARCPGCREHLAELSALADDLLLLTPPAEPPSGFESTVLSRMQEPPRVPRYRRVLELAAVAVLVAALSGGAVWWADRSDRQLAAELRETLATGQGQYLAAYPLKDAGGQRRGAVFAYQGEPTWLLCALEEPLPEGWYEVQLVTSNGVTHRVASGRYLGGIRAWGYEVRVPVEEVALLRVVDKQGALVLSARLEDVTHR